MNFSPIAPPECNGRRQSGGRPFPAVLALAGPSGPKAPTILGVFLPGSPKVSNSAGRLIGLRGHLRGHFRGRRHVYNDRGSSC